MLVQITLYVTPNAARCEVKDHLLLTDSLAIPPNSLLLHSISSKLLELFVAQTLDVLLSEMLNAIALCFGLSSPEPGFGFLPYGRSWSGVRRLCRSRWPRLSVISDAMGMRSGNRIGSAMVCGRDRGVVTVGRV